MMTVFCPASFGNQALGLAGAVSEELASRDLAVSERVGHLLPAELCQLDNASGELLSATQLDSAAAGCQGLWHDISLPKG